MPWFPSLGIGRNDARREIDGRGVDEGPAREGLRAVRGALSPGITSQKPFLSMAFAKLTVRGRLRDIEAYACVRGGRLHNRRRFGALTIKVAIKPSNFTWNHLT